MYFTNNLFLKIFNVNNFNYLKILIYSYLYKLIFNYLL